MCLLVFLTALYPVGAFSAAVMGYRLKLLSSTALCIAIATVSAVLTAIDIILKTDHSGKLTRVLAALVTPISMINAAMIIVHGAGVLQIVCVVISVACALYLTITRGRPIVLKIASMILSVVMLFPLALVCIIGLTLGDLGQNTVVRTIESPSGLYYAAVIDSDQGALGGNTLVDVHESKRYSAVIFEIEKKPQRVYTGDWGEADRMDIYWVSDDRIIINSIEYKVKR